MKLIELLRELDYTLVSGDMGVEITGVIYDSRKVEEGSLFVCLTGFRADGHDYIPDALAQGARALVGERERRELMDSLSHTRTLINQAYGGFNTTSDSDLIESYVFEINALQARYNYLLRRVKELEEAVP